MTAPANQPPSSSSMEQTVLSGAQVMRVEMDHMTSVSRLHPRNREEILEALVADVRACPELAEEYRYHIEWKDGHGKLVVVEGLSIEGAMELSQAWGNCGSKCVVTGEDAGAVYLMGIFVDFQTNVRTERPFVVTKIQHRRDGAAVLVGEEKFVQALMIGVSKAVRNAILKGLPRAFVYKFSKAVDEVVEAEASATINDLADTSWIQATIDVFESLGVTRARLEAGLGKPVADVTPKELANLRTVGRSIRTEPSLGEIHFPSEGNQAAAAEASADLADDLVVGTAAAADDQDEPAPAKTKTERKKPAAPPAERELEVEPESGDPSKQGELAIGTDGKTVGSGYCRHCRKRTHTESDDLDHPFDPAP